jgi:hypothetical protein
MCQAVMLGLALCRFCFRSTLGVSGPFATAPGDHNNPGPAGVQADAAKIAIADRPIRG